MLPGGIIKAGYMCFTTANVILHTQPLSNAQGVVFELTYMAAEGKEGRKRRINFFLTLFFSEG